MPRSSAAGGGSLDADGDFAGQAVWPRGRGGLPVPALIRLTLELCGFSGGVAHAPSPDVRSGHPVLRSLGCRLHSAILASFAGIRRLPGHGQPLPCVGGRARGGRRPRRVHAQLPLRGSPGGRAAKARETSAFPPPAEARRGHGWRMGHDGQRPPLQGHAAAVGRAACMRNSRCSARLDGEPSQARETLAFPPPAEARRGHGWRMGHDGQRPPLQGHAAAVGRAACMRNSRCSARLDGEPSQARETLAFPPPAEARRGHGWPGGRYSLKSSSVTWLR